MNDQQPVVTVDNLTKTFRIATEPSSGIKQNLINLLRGKRGYREFTPLKDISFTVNQGEFFGIVGRNGSGKSTLLKTISGIYTPTSGGVSVSGTLVPFIELGVGFNPELSGRENVFMNGALLGFSRKETEAMYDEIVDFAEIHDFMDEKLKNYSSGMQVRLAFAIAVKAEGNVLLLDEVLAVGDEAFQRKCFDYFEQIKAKKQTVILVTHDMRTVEQFCSRALLLRDGKIELIGNPSEVAAEYTSENQEQIKKQHRVRHIKSESTAINIELLKEGVESDNFLIGETMKVAVSWDKGEVENVGISIHKQSGERMFATNTFKTDLQPKIIKDRSCEYEVGLHLAPGTYYIRVRLMGDSPQKTVELVNNGPLFDVFPVDATEMVDGLARLPYNWN